MRKFLSLLFIILLSAGLLSGCENRTPAESQDFSVVASIYPVYIALLNVTDGVPDVSVTLMTETEMGCLHDYTLLPGDMKRLESCDVFVINGAGMENFLGRVLENRADLPVIDTSQGIGVLESAGDHEEEHAEEHVEEHAEDDDSHTHEHNAHIWTSVTRHIRQVQTIIDGLCVYDPAHSAQYRENGESYIVRLETLRSQIQEQLKGSENRPMIAFHEAFAYFAEEFGLTLEAVIEELPDQSPSPQRIKEMVEQVKEHGIGWLVVEPGAPHTSARVIANEAGCELLEFDPIVTGEQDRSAYLSRMEANAARVRQALTKE